MAQNSNSKSTRLGIALRKEDYAVIAKLEKRWFGSSKLFRPRISDVIRKALEVAEQSGI